MLMDTNGDSPSGEYSGSRPPFWNTQQGHRLVSAQSTFSKSFNEQPFNERFRNFRNYRSTGLLTDPHCTCLRQSKLIAKSEIWVVTIFAMHFRGGISPLKSNPQATTWAPAENDCFSSPYAINSQILTSAKKWWQTNKRTKTYCHPLGVRPPNVECVRLMRLVVRCS